VADPRLTTQPERRIILILSPLIELIQIIKGKKKGELDPEAS